MRATFGRFPSGVIALCATDMRGDPIGMAVSAFVNVSLDPPLVGVFVQATSTTWPKLKERPRIGLSVLGAGQQASCRQLAAREVDRFANVSWESTDHGSVFLHGASAWFDCEIESETTTGDHQFVLLRILEHDFEAEQDPLVFYASSFHELSSLLRTN
ncbi:flavin reductase family protein [Gordonia paraffinivorans]|uniref:flavin reductase family protein n=1 Tax=Gordonia paraffinivorans TaxID=175628 RepID=UPI001E59E632|nr:flavin reductase family protein [Gordonia paraffinivorans]MCD2147383.1 flavin reductase family protein [Gordonia paraffinivorans]